MSRKSTAFVAFAALALSACATHQPFVGDGFRGWQSQTLPEDADVSYRVFLLGGIADDQSVETLRLLRSHLQAAGSPSAVVFLGDDIAKRDSTVGGVGTKPNRLREQVRTLENVEGRFVFIPGDLEWEGGRSDGLDGVLERERLVESLLGRGNVVRPDGGFPGPTEIELTEELSLLVLNTQWWLHNYRKPYGDTGDYKLVEDGDFLIEIDDIIKRNRDKRLLVVGHHPLFSNGAHAGRYSWRTHLFPLTSVQRHAWLPLPVVGSLTPLYVKYFGLSTQDLAQPRYASMRKALESMFSRHDGLVYVSGHERNLQYFRKGVLRSQQHYIVSGAAGSVEHVASGRGAAFAAVERGFVQLTYLNNGALWMEAWSPGGSTRKGRLLFRAELEDPSPEFLAQEPSSIVTTEVPDYRDSTVVQAISQAYSASRLRQRIYGRRYRDAWAVPVETPVLDMGHEAGGLTLLRRGGGVQTHSLHFVGSNGMQYVLRSVDKDPARTVPKHLRVEVATDFIQDQVSSLHPFGVLLLPTMYEAAGIYHTNPRQVYVPHDPRLGIYKDQFAGQIMMIEERPDDDMSTVASFGYSKKVMSSARLFREINADNDHRVDQRNYLKARLFDLLIADWDRHEDQWRWASIEPPDGKGKIYRPIPRDHDWAFFNFDGWLPSMLKYVMPKFQSFDKKYGDIRGLTRKALRQDRRFTNELSRQDWSEIAAELQRDLSDDVVEAALRAWPDTVYALYGAEFSEILRARRDQLQDVADECYLLIARVTDIVGSDKHERFHVTRLPDGHAEVVVYKTNKEGETLRELYRRRFDLRETKEIRLYGLGGNDQFVVEGDVDAGVRVRAIGGAGTDRFFNSSDVKELGNKTIFYDTRDGNTWELVGETELVRSVDPSINSYDPAGYDHNRSFPLLVVESNKDDGLILGGGIRMLRHGFRKQPFAVEHKIRSSFATQTSAYAASYQGRYVSLLRGWDLEVESLFRSPASIRNFYGLGNETRNDEGDARFYQARLGHARLAPGLVRGIGEGFRFSVRPAFEFTKVRQDEDRIVTRPQPGISPNSFDDQWSLGLEAELRLDGRDNQINPRQGLYWMGGAHVRTVVRGETETYGTLRTELALYTSPLWTPQFTVAVRAGGAHHIGAFPFYDAVTLGGNSNLRGYRGTRFAGRSSFYQNVELRVLLTDFSTYVALGRLGLLAFMDNGRVWTDGEDSSRWHQGYGAGLWIYVFRTMVATGTVGRSVEESTFTFKVGFLF